MEAFRLNPQSLLFAAFLGALAAFPPISIDLALPALVQIGHALGSTGSEAGFTLSFFMAGFAAGPIAYGPLSDARGRKPVLLAGLVLFTAGGIGSALAPSLVALLAARLLQGLGAGAGMTIAMAMVRDLFEGAAMQRRLAAITVVANVAPIVAPSIGVGLLASAGWRGIYGVMGALGLVVALVTWLALAETSKPAGSRVAPPRERYRRVWSNRSVVGHILLNGLGFGWMFAYVAGSPLVLLRVLHVTPIVYAAMFATTGAAIVAGATLNGWLGSRGLGSRGTLAIAVGLALLATLSLIALSALHELSLLNAMPLLAASTFAFGFAAPTAAQGALEPMPELAGVAGGLLASVQMLFGAASSSLVALLFPTLGAYAMSGVMAGCALLAGAVWMGLGHVSDADLQTGLPIEA